MNRKSATVNSEGVTKQPNTHNTKTHTKGSTVGEVMPGPRSIAFWVGDLAAILACARAPDLPEGPLWAREPQIDRHKKSREEELPLAHHRKGASRKITHAICPAMVALPVHHGLV